MSPYFWEPSLWGLLSLFGMSEHAIYAVLVFLSRQLRNALL